jgi:16S rRNA (guanine966-N2)-methyltransferase
VIERNLVSVSRDTARDGRPEPLLVRRPVELYLAGEPDRSYDVVFADPPYALGEEALRVVLDRLVEGEWLAADAVVVVERSARSAGPVWPDPLDSIKQKRYGEGMLWYGRRR